MTHALIAVKGKKTEKIQDLKGIENFEKIIVDLGTGDGRFVYENAKIFPQNYYIGVDTLAKSMEEFSSKTAREKLNNALFVVGNAESFLPGINYIVDEIFINFPWGSLLAYCVKPSEIFLQELKRVLKVGGLVQMTFGYSEEFEQKQVERLELPSITLDSLQTKIAENYIGNGFRLCKVAELTKSEVFEIGSTWGKKLKFGRDRPVFKIVLEKL
jgi:16S rRNA (adenine(1408)-N(1))-methyltransferase